MKRFYFSLALACLLAGTLWAADDPFYGKWRLNMEKSKFAGEQTKIEDLGAHKYKWTSGNVSDTITADGTDQPVPFDRTISIAPEGAWEIKAYNGDGLTFNTPAYQDVLNMKFGGKDYEEKGPNVGSGSTSAGKRVNAHTLELTDKVKGEAMDHTKFEVSQDGKTLTLTIRETGQPKALTIVYDKM